MKILTIALTASALLLSGAAAADADLAKKNGCATCHDVSAKKIGPTWKDIAKKASEADVIAAIEKGVKGKYGKIPMPPQPKAKGDAAALAKWILTHK